MPTLQRKRRAAGSPPPAVEDDLTPQPTETRATSVGSDYDADSREAEGSSSSTPQLIKNLVRLALASEYSRTPIRRNDITNKVLGASSRQFKSVFDGAQLALQQTFGMEMVELPAREKVTTAQRRAAQKSQTRPVSSVANKAWVLRSILPEKYRDAKILPSPRIPTTEIESAYVGLYTFVIALITLSGGRLQEAKLERYLERCNANVSTPVDSREKLLKRMEKEGYVFKIRENTGGAEDIEYVVGPRGKVEVGEHGVKGLVRSVYGDAVNDTLETRMEKSLSTSRVRQEEGEGASSDTRQSKPKGRPKKWAITKETAETDDSDE